MTYFPRDAVDKITDNFATMFWYTIFQFIVICALTFLAYQARTLGMLFERGALGLGVHYGLGQFDEVINHEAIKNKKKCHSMFIEDAKLPRWNADLATPMAYCIGHDYGALHKDGVDTKKGTTEDEFEATFEDQHFTTKEKIALMADREGHYDEI